MGCKANDECPNKRQERRRHRDTQGGCRVKTQAEIGVMCPPAKDGQGLLEDPRSQETPEADSPSEAPEGANPADTWILDLSLQNWERTHSCCFEPLSLWSFVTAALGNNTVTPLVSQNTVPRSWLSNSLSCSPTSKRIPAWTRCRSVPPAPPALALPSPSPPRSWEGPPALTSATHFLCAQVSLPLAGSPGPHVAKLTATPGPACP